MKGSMELHEVSDMGLVAALKTLGYPNKGEHLDGKRVVFTYEWDDNMADIEREYFRNNLDVDAQTFNLNLKAVKQVIYQLRNPGGFTPYK